MDEASIAQHLEVTKTKTINYVVFGSFKCETWYYSPFPKGYHNRDIIYFCEFCLKFFTTNNEL